MVIILVVFAILVLYGLPRFIKNKETAKVMIIYVFFMAASLAVSLLTVSSKRPPGPAEWIGWLLKMIGVVK